MSFPPDLLEELNKVKLISIDYIIKSKINDPIETYRRELEDEKQDNWQGCEPNRGIDGRECNRQY